VRTQHIVGALIFTALVAAMSLPNTSAAPATQWTRLPDTHARGQLGLLRVGKKLVVAWVRQRATKYDLMATTIGPNDTIVDTSPIVSGWLSIGDAALVPTKNGGIRVFFEGTRKNLTDKLSGLNTAVAPAAGTPWTLTPASIVVSDEAYTRTPAAAVAKDLTPFEAWHTSGSVIAVHRGLDPNDPNGHFDGGTACCTVSPGLATDAKTGALTVAWCDDAEKSNGIMAQGVNLASGAPSGQRQTLSGSATPNAGKLRRRCDGNHRTAIVARHGGGVFVAAPVGYPTATAVKLWHLGTKQPVTLGNNANNHDLVSISADRFGRLWVAWFDDGSQAVIVRRSDTQGTNFGPPIKLTPPGNPANIYDVELSAAATGADVFIFRLGFDATNSFFYAHVASP
jgi:hypothetical protein